MRGVARGGNGVAAVINGQDSTRGLDGPTDWTEAMGIEGQPGNRHLTRPLQRLILPPALCPLLHPFLCHCRSPQPAQQAGAAQICLWTLMLEERQPNWKRGVLCMKQSGKGRRKLKKKGGGGVHLEEEGLRKRR